MLPFGRIWYIYNLHYEKFADGTVKCIEDEIPFELPEGWGWCRLQTICEKEIKRGKAPKYVEKSGTLVFAQKCNTKKGKINITLAQYLDESTLHKYSPDLFTRYNDIIINSTGTGTLGRIGIFEESDDLIKLPIVPDSHITTVRAFSINVAKYVYLFLKANQPYFENSGEGSTNQKELRPEVIKTFLIAIPPYKEQEKIVEKFEAVCTIIDLLDAYTEDYNQAIKSIKSKILDLAIRGKLVPQDPNDEPASVLLERIRAEKEELIRQGKIKRDKKESVIFKGEDNSYYVSADGIKQQIEDYMQYSLPEGWVWICLKDVATISSGKTPTSELLSENGKIPYYKISDMNVEGNELFLDKTTNYLNDEYDGVVFNKGSFVFPKNGGAVLTNKKRILLHNSLVDLNTGVITFSPFIDAEYAFLMFSFIDFSKLYKGSTIPTVDANVISNLIFALPPLNEQQHIVQVVKKTFAQLDAIAESLN